MYSTNIRPESEVRESLSLINSSPKARIFFSGKLPMTEDEDGIFVEYTVLAMVHMIYYGDVTLGCRAGYVTMKKYVLYLFVDSWTWFALALTDLKVTMVSHVIDKVRVCASIKVLLDGFIVMWNKKPDICHNGG